MSYGRQRSGRGIAAAVMVILTVLYGAGSLVGYVTGPGFEYQNAVHGYVENAKYADTPNLIKEELEKAVSGMRDLGLTDEMYGKYWPWEKTPDWRMDYQYKHMQAVIDRAQAVIDWQAEAGNTSSYGDVYEQKVKAVRAFINDSDGWIDDIAQGAYIVNFHPFYAVWGWVFGIALMAVSVITILYWAKE